MMAISAFCVWLACLVTYLASDKQQLIARALPKGLGWAGFVGFNIIALYCLSQQFIYTTALLINLAFIIAMWLTLILIASHLKGRLVITNGIGIGLFLALMVAGSYVA